MNYFDYFFDDFPVSARRKLGSRLEEINKWDVVPMDAYIYSPDNRVRLKFVLHQFKRFERTAEGEELVYCEQIGSLGADGYSFQPSGRKYYLWVEDIYLEVLKETEEKHNNSWLLMAAVKRGDLETVEKLIEKGFDLEQVDRLGRTVLSHAILGSELIITKRLIEAGANIAVVEKSGQNLLHISCRQNPLMLKGGKREIVDFLLSMSIPVNAKDEDLRTPFHLFCRSGKLFSVGLATLFLEKGAALHEKNKHGHSVLAEAMLKNNLEAMEFLINKGVSINDSVKGDEHLMNCVESAQVYDFFEKRMDQLTPLGRETLIGTRLKLLFNMDQ